MISDVKEIGTIELLYNVCVKGGAPVGLHLSFYVACGMVSHGCACDFVWL